MRKITLLQNLVITCLLLFSIHGAFAQQHIAPHPPPVHINKYKKPDTIKVNPYVADTLFAPIPIKRAYFHDKIDKEQKTADEADGLKDGKIRLGNDAGVQWRSQTNP